MCTWRVAVCARAHTRITADSPTPHASQPPHADCRPCPPRLPHCLPPAATQPRLESCLRAEGRPTTGRVAYAGRDPSASTATGYGEVHAQEQALLLERALDLDYHMDL